MVRMWIAQQCVHGTNYELQLFTECRLDCKSLNGFAVHFEHYGFFFYACHLLNAILIFIQLSSRVEGIIEVCILAFLVVVLENLTIKLIRAFPLFLLL